MNIFLFVILCVSLTVNVALFLDLRAHRKANHKLAVMVTDRFLCDVKDRR